MGKACQSLIIDVSKNTLVQYIGIGKPCQILLIDLARHVFDIFEWDALCCQQRRHVSR